MNPSGGRLRLPFILFGLLASAVTCNAAEDRDELLRQRDEVKLTAISKQVLAFYYGWYGNPTVSSRWVHWEKVDEAKKTIGSSAHFPTLGAYDSHGSSSELALRQRWCAR